MHLQISVGTKFKLKLAMLIFCTKFPEEGYFRSKAEKSHFCLRPWSFFTILIFAHGGWQSQWLFNDSSNRRDNYLRFAKASFVLFLAFTLILLHYFPKHPADFLHAFFLNQRLRPLMTGQLKNSYLQRRYWTNYFRRHLLRHHNRMPVSLFKRLTL